MPNARRIDVHHHMMAERSPLFDLPADHVLWSVDNALKVMDDNEIDTALLSPTPKLPADPAAMLAMIEMRDGPKGRTKEGREQMRLATRSSNEEVAAIAKARPDRFGFFSNLALLNAEDAIGEAAYAFDELGADGVFMPTNVGPVYMGDPAFDPLFEDLDRRGAVVFIHPMHLPCPMVSGIAAHVADFLLSTVRAATNLVQKGATQRFPNLKFILTHGGGFIPFAVQRFSRTLADTDPDRSQEDLFAEYEKFYFDLALATAPDTVASLLAFADPSHVVYGSDFPPCQPHDVAYFADQFDSIELDPAVREACNRGNAEKLFPRLAAVTSQS